MMKIATGQELLEQGVTEEELEECMKKSATEMILTPDVDYRLAIELDIYETYIKEIKKHEESLASIIAKRLKKEELEGEDNDLIRQQYYFHLENTIPRMVYNPLVVSLWGLLESTINSYASFLYEKEKQQQNTIKKIDNIKGKNKTHLNIIKKSEVYFNIILKMNVNFDNIEQLLCIRDLRNHLAHTNGESNDLGEERIREIISVIGGNKFPSNPCEVNISHGSTILSYEIVVSMHKAIASFLEDIAKETSKKYKLPTCFNS